MHPISYIHTFLYIHRCVCVCVYIWDSLVAQMVKSLPAVQETQGHGKIPWRRKWQPTLVFLPEKPHGRRSQVRYGPWGHKESDMTEHLHFLHFHLAMYMCTDTIIYTDTHRYVHMAVCIYIYIYTYTHTHIHGEGNGNPLQYSCLGGPMERADWQATYNPWCHKSQTGLAD